MGYSADEIYVMKNLTGNETLEQMSTYGILADCTCYNTLVDHYYRTSTDKTYFLVSYGWEWDKCPAWVLTDCAGVGWNHDFHPDESLDTSSKNYNTTYKTYVNQSDATDKKYSSKAMVEKELNTAEDQFDMNGFYGNAYYVKAGSAQWHCLKLVNKMMPNSRSSMDTMKCSPHHLQVIPGALVLVQKVQKASLCLLKSCIVILQAQGANKDGFEHIQGGEKN